MIHPWTLFDTIIFYSAVSVSASLSMNLFFQGDPGALFADDKKGYFAHQASTLAIGIAVGKYVLAIWPNDIPVFLIASLPIGLVSGLIWLFVFNAIYQILMER